MIRRFPSRRQIRAVELGADELMAQLEWVLRDRPRALRNAQRRYQSFYIATLASLEKSRRQSGNDRTGQVK
jgi:hypothetical protein